MDGGSTGARGTPAELKAPSPEGKLDEVFRAITLPDTVHPDQAKAAAAAEVSA